MIRVLYFASLRTLAGKEEEHLELGNQITLRELSETIEKTSPQLAEMIREKKVLVSVNQDVADLDAIIHDGDEVALLPPFSGGSM